MPGRRCCGLGSGGCVCFSIVCFRNGERYYAQKKEVLCFCVRLSNICRHNLFIWLFGGGDSNANMYFDKIALRNRNTSEKKNFCLLHLDVPTILLALVLFEMQSINVAN